MLRTLYFSMFSSFAFNSINCTLAGVENVARAIAAERRYLFDVGRYDLGEIYDLNFDGCARGKSAASSVTTVLFQALNNEKTIVASNSIDGWATLCNAIALRLKTDLYAFSFADEKDPNARNALEYRDYSSSVIRERVVYAMKDPRWKFYQRGEPLHIEDVDNYRKRKVVERLNKQLLISYCSKLGLHIEHSDFLNPRGTVLRIQNKW